MCTEAGEYVNERIGAEKVNSASEQVANPWLRDTKKLGHLSLLETLGRDELLDLDQKISPNYQMRRLLTAKAKIPEHIAGRWSHFYFHDGSNLPFPSWLAEEPPNG